MMDFLGSAAQEFPSAVAVDDGATLCDYAELSRRADRVARAVAGAVPPGSRVVLLMENGPSLITAIHAVPRAGCVLAPLSTKLTRYELAEAIRVLDAAAVLADTANWTAAGVALSEAGVRVPVLDFDSLARLDRSDGAAAPTRPQRAMNGHGAREWAVLWTSGTTGRARGVSLTAENLAASAAASRERLSLGPSDRWYLGLSCAHIG